MRVIKSPFILLLIALLFQSCTSIINPEASELKTGIKQLKPRPKARLVPKKNMLVYVQYRNTSGTTLNVEEKIKEKVRELEYRVVDDIDTAQFVLSADLRCVNTTVKDNDGHSTLGALLGAATGAVLGHNVGNGSRTDRVVGGIAGALIGGTLGKAIDNRNRITTIDMVIDVKLGERIVGGVRAQRAISSERNLNYYSRTPAHELRENGSASEHYRENVHFQRQDNFLFHENRFIATAQKLKLTYGEAQTALAGKIATAIAHTLP